MLNLVQTELVVCVFHNTHKKLSLEKLKHLGSHNAENLNSV